MLEGLSQKMGNIIGFVALALSSGTAISSYNEWLVHFDQHAPAYGFFCFSICCDNSFNL